MGTSWAQSVDVGGHVTGWPVLGDGRGVVDLGPLGLETAEAGWWFSWSAPTQLIMWLPQGTSGTVFQEELEAFFFLKKFLYTVFWC